MFQKKMLIGLFISSIAFISCNDNDNELEQDTAASELSLNLEGLQDLGSDFSYEGWLIVNGSPVTTGVFNVNSEGELSQSKFEVDPITLSSATKFVLSIEPANDLDPAPSDTKYLSGDFNGNSAEISSNIIADFSEIEGAFVLATPSDDSENASNNENGIWWFKPGEPSMAGLNLPDLPAGWKYEGWIVSDGIPLSTGIFTDVSAADASSVFSGSDGTPNYPGEDFITNAPEGLNFPLDLRSKTAVISIEPYPDNNSSPFTLKPLVATINNDTAPTTQTMTNNVLGSFPTGSVNR